MKRCLKSLETGSGTEKIRKGNVSEEVAMPNGQDIKVNFPPNLHGGVYSNNMVVTHTKEEFILDFLMVAPPAGAVTARVIVSPGHMKRILAALQDNILR